MGGRIDDKIHIGQAGNDKTSDVTGEVDNEYFVKWIIETLYE